MRSFYKALSVRALFWKSTANNWLHTTLRRAPSLTGFLNQSSSSLFSDYKVGTAIAESLLGVDGDLHLKKEKRESNTQIWNLQGWGQRRPMEVCELVKSCPLPLGSSPRSLMYSRLFSLCPKPISHVFNLPLSSLGLLSIVTLLLSTHLFSLVATCFSAGPLCPLRHSQILLMMIWVTIPARCGICLWGVLARLLPLL